MNMKNGNNNVLGAIGNTPLVQLITSNGITDVKIFGKLEGIIPAAPIKDRPAYYMIKMAEESGELTKDKIIIEPTSGNTGIAIAMIGAAKGYKVKAFMPDVSAWKGSLSCRLSAPRWCLPPLKKPSTALSARA